MTTIEIPAWQSAAPLPAVLPCNRDHMTQCVNALLSGVYTQGQMFLRYAVREGGVRQDDAWCCAGIFCEMARIGTGDGVWVQPLHDDEDEPYKRFTDSSGENNAFPTDAVTGWLGVTKNLMNQGDTGFDDEFLVREVPVIIPQDMRTVNPRDGRPHFMPAGTNMTAVRMNDNGYSFRQIADAIAFTYLRDAA